MPRSGTAQWLPRHLARGRVPRIHPRRPAAHPDEGRRQGQDPVKDKLKALHADVDMGITPKAGYSAYTVRQAAEDWLREGLEGRSAKTIKKNENEFLSLSWRLSVPRSSANYRRPTCGRPCPRWPPGTRAPS